MQIVELTTQDNNPKRMPKKKKKKRAFRLWEMTSDPKSFSMLLFLGIFFITTSFICLSDVVQQRNEHRMEISRLHRESGSVDGGQRKKKSKPLTKEEKKKKYKIFNISLRQAIKKEKSL